MEIIRSIEILKRKLQNENSVGFIPTMGALHNGHQSLINKSKSENKITVVSIFVNPTQFLEGEDFSEYPRTLEKDSQICNISGVDYIFFPESSEIYFSDELMILAPKKGGYILDGFKRVGHFNGVLQVVLKLLNIVNPDKAYFGKKDAQQLILIQKMTKELFLNVKIIPVDIVRDFDGLALSSRNIYLSKNERKKALSIPKSLEKVSKLIIDGERNINIIRDSIYSQLEKLDIEYIEILSRDLEIQQNIEISNTIILVAVQIGKTRLIDNLWI